MFLYYSRYLLVCVCVCVFNEWIYEWLHINCTLVCCFFFVFAFYFCLISLHLDCKSFFCFFFLLLFFVWVELIKILYCNYKIIQGLTSSFFVAACHSFGCYCCCWWFFGWYFIMSLLIEVYFDLSFLFFYLD